MTLDDAKRKAHASARDAHGGEHPGHDATDPAEGSSFDDHEGGFSDQPSIL